MEQRTGRSITHTGPLLPLIDCALIAVADGCPPETSMYLCSFGEDNSQCDCAQCWTTYLLYVANRRSYDPYARHRKDE